MVVSAVAKSAKGFISSVLLVASAASCGLVTGIGDLSREGDAVDASTDGAPVDGARGDAEDALLADGAPLDSSAIDAGVDAACPGTAGPAAVRVGAFCIDSTEVTHKDYSLFLARSTAPANAGPLVCASKTTHAPSGAAATPTSPQTFVDWCDAYAYCAWAGKRLCGNVAGGPSGSLVDSTDQWFTACSRASDGNHTFPYGNAFKPFACNIPEVDSGGAAPVASFAGCVGGYPGIYDMSGNVYEWEDSCVMAGGVTSCVQRSGSFADPPGASQTCAYSRSVALTIADNDIGFRCCSP